MEKDTQMWNQYHNLRDEIRGADSLNYQIMAIVVGAIAALLTAGIRETDPLARVFVFLCVYVVTIPGYKLLRGNRLRIWRISTYLRVFVEPELDFVKWETRLDLQRQQEEDSSERSKLSTFASLSEWTIISLMNTIAALGAIFSLLRVVDADPNVKIGGIAVIAVANLWIVFWASRQERALRRQGDVEKRFRKSWQKIKDEMQLPGETGRPTQGLKRTPDGTA